MSEIDRQPLQSQYRGSPFRTPQMGTKMEHFYSQQHNSHRNNEAALGNGQGTAISQKRKKFVTFTVELQKDGGPLGCIYLVLFLVA